MPVDVVEFHAPERPWSVNEVPATVKAKIARTAQKREWRRAAFYATCARVHGATERACGPSTVQVTIPFSTSRRRDPHNYTGTVVKAIIDGLVDAGVWPDDNPEWVTVLEPELAAGGPVRVTITPRNVGVVG